MPERQKVILKSSGHYLPIISRQLKISFNYFRNPDVMQEKTELDNDIVLRELFQCEVGSMGHFLHRNDFVQDLFWLVAFALLIMG